MELYLVHEASALKKKVSKVATIVGKAWKTWGTADVPTISIYFNETHE